MLRVYVLMAFYLNLMIAKRAKARAKYLWLIVAPRAATLAPCFAGGF